MILFVTKGMMDDASSRVRVLNYLPYLKKDEIPFKVISQKHWREPRFKNRVLNWLKKNSLSLRVLWSLLVYKPSVLYIQKIRLSNFTLKCIEKLKVKTIFDLDDGIFLNADQSVNETIINYIKRFDKIISCSTQYLKYFSGCYHIPSCVSSVESYNRSYDSINLCWIGSPWTQQYLIPIREQIFQLLEEFPLLTFTIVGSHHLLEYEHVRIKKQKWSEEAELSVLRNSHVGIMPLNTDIWSRYKCAYKLILYMMHGVVAVGTEHGLNKEVIRNNKTGKLVNKLGDWYSSLSTLLRDKKNLVAMSIEGRTYAINNFSYSHNYNKWKTIILES